MKWMEFVHMRSSPDVREASLVDLNEQIARCRLMTGLTAISVLKHTVYPGDVAVILSWDNNRQPVKTREGIALAEVMSRHGSVEHAVWEVVSIQPKDLAATPIEHGPMYGERP